MKRTVFITACAIAFSGGVSAVSAYEAGPFVSADTAVRTAAAALIVTPLKGTGEIARRGRGRDDPAGDDRGVHGAGHAANMIGLPAQDLTFARRGRGADDAPGHVRRGRGADDGPNHA